ARPADIAVANAQILSAQGQLVAALAAYAHTMIKAPVAGTITRVDVRVGEQAVAMKEVMILQDVGDLHVEANVSEANVASLKTGQSIDYTFDALGPDRHISGVIQQINPASTIVSGVVNYKVTAGVDRVADIKPGMTANMTILVATKDQVVAVPSNAILDQDGKRVVRVVDDVKKGTYHTVDVQMGLQGDSGLVEIVSGLSPGQTIVTSIK
ncbi:efflux RND transporter periplasmic adaptor subunit, partial [Candidatus Uhrbacteria bacterium]|nr:efflux RND transporter periplasmic adaptor subunit [Candidatus Uhrbacteria bacterium]